MSNGKNEQKEAENEMSELEGVVDGKNQETTQMEKELKLLETNVNHLRKLLEEEKKRGEDYLSRVKYVQADFENYRKRIDREVKEMEDFSTTKLVWKLLPVLDELELAIASAQSTKDTKALVEGVRMVHKNLSQTLEGEGLRPIEAVGKPFDPRLHEAVDKVQGKKVGDDIVIEEIRRGFVFKDKVLRPSMVKVELASRPQNRNSGRVGEVDEDE